MKNAQSVSEYIAASASWQNELKRLRAILVATGLEEDVKWGGPCYTIGGQNVVGLAAFKSYFGLWFFQGALLKDEKRVLINAQEGRTKAMRQWRMTSGEDIEPVTIKRYIREAIKIAREGRKITPDRKKAVAVPPELKRALQTNQTAGDKFRKMTPGLRREFAEYIADAKRDKTKHRRLQKILPMITAGVGLNDKYR